MNYAPDRGMGMTCKCQGRCSVFFSPVAYNCVIFFLLRFAMVVVDVALAIADLVALVVMLLLLTLLVTLFSSRLLHNCVNFFSASFRHGRCRCLLLLILLLLLLCCCC